MVKEKNKRITAHLIPYKIKNGDFLFFLQKRSADAERHPNWFNIFGGGIEKEETPEKAMLRETKEELDFIPDNYFYLGEYSDDYSISYYYAVEVKDNFKTDIIYEGDFGRFFTEEEIKNEEKLSENNKKIISHLIKKLG